MHCRRCSTNTARLGWWLLWVTVRFPVRCDVAQSQPDQLGSRYVAGDVPANLENLAQLCIGASDHIGRLDHFADRRGKRKERNHLG